MIVECCMCNEELAIEDISLVGEKALVKVWPCETCSYEVTGQLVSELDMPVEIEMDEG